MRQVKLPLILLVVLTVAVVLLLFMKIHFAEVKMVKRVNVLKNLYVELLDKAALESRFPDELNLMQGGVINIISPSIKNEILEGLRSGNFVYTPFRADDLFEKNYGVNHWVLKEGESKNLIVWRCEEGQLSCSIDGVVSVLTNE